MADKQLYEFGPFRLDPGERQLLCNHQPVALTPKSFDLLVALVENSGHLLEKEELLQRVWPGQFVEESNLSFNISTLRKALGDGRDGQRYRKGKLADLVLLEANPLEDIRNTQKINAVVVNGRLLDRKALDGLLAQAEAAVKTN